MTAIGTPLDPHDALLVVDCPETLRRFNDAGVLHPADIHTAIALCRFTSIEDPAVLLAAALAVRGPRVGHVCVDLTTVAVTVTGRDEDVDLAASLPWPEDPDAWVTAVRDSELVAAAGSGVEPRPLTLDGSRLYLDRYWRYEQAVARQLKERATRELAVDDELLRAGIERLFPLPEDRPEERRPERREREEPGPDLQRVGAATALTRSFAVLAGGPGTGKTTTVAKILVLLDEQRKAIPGRELRIALVAPTGKAAARLEESLREALGRDEFAALTKELLTRLETTEASTIHRLLRRHPGNQSRFRHHAGEPLPHDVVIVDEASMVPLSLMAKLLDALPAHARLILVGDPQQLQSVEAGAVLGDIVGPALLGPRWSSPGRRQLAELTGEDLSGLGGEEPAARGFGDGVVVLQRVYRFDEESGIADLASAIQHGNAEEVLKILDSDRSDVTWIRRLADAEDESATELGAVRERIVDVGTRVRAAARSKDTAQEALVAAAELRVLCAHRRGDLGVSGWVRRIEQWLGTDNVGGYGAAEWPTGRPIMLTVNDHQLRLYNGDIGVVVKTTEGPRVAFPTTGEPRLVPPTRLEAIETVHAMTIHKSQGSQFDHAVVVLPTEKSLILSRELLYTGITRAKKRVTVIGSERAVRAAVERQVRRASGLRDRLWETSSIV